MSKKDELKRRFRHIPEIIMNQGELDIADLEIAEDYVEHIPMPPQFPTNRQGFKDFVVMLRTAFPDLHYEVDHLTTNDLIGENQKVVHRIVGRREVGRALGEYQYTGNYAADGCDSRLVRKACRSCTAQHQVERCYLL